ncbi:MAG: DNA helicase RecG, partial [Candidatus Cellulosilyticum pullistercoris]|nr:DNA helicase RecG [Candidatus Cellulosilyticum pullistercoris]
MELMDSIYDLKGVGEKVGDKLAKLGIHTLKDMIEHYPREYEDRRKITPISECQLNESNNILAKVCSKPQLTKKGSKVLVSFRVKDETEALMITFFGQAYMKNNFKLGETYLFYGKVKHKYGYHEMESPEYQKVDDGHQLNTVAKITPIYPTTQKLSQKVIRGLIETCLKEVLSGVEDHLPKRIRQQYDLVEKKEALQGIHFPKDSDHFFQARKRLVFEELFMLQLSLYQLKADFAKKLLGVAHQITPELKAFMQTLPFELTGAQKRVMREIVHDMKSTYAMNRLVQGDVGSG